MKTTTIVTAAADYLEAAEERRRGRGGSTRRFRLASRELSRQLGKRAMARRRMRR